jgi:hypothetical protein
MNKENADGIRELFEDLKREAVEEYKREHGIGWIPCSKRMPEERPSMFAKLKGTDRWSMLMFEKVSDEVHVTIEIPGKGRIVDTAKTIDGKWKCDAQILGSEAKVVAWMPNPEPYMGE